ncbi:MAG: LysR family transcriptional regulator [Halopseudomonas yangmingensis]
MTERHGAPSLGRMDLNLFRVFEVIYRERNLTRAAAVLHVSQSAVSHALARLREQFADPLFVRQGRGVAPTAMAQRLAPGIFDSLAGLQQSLARLGRFDPATDTRLVTLNMPEQLEPTLLPGLLQQLSQAAPGLRVRTSSVRWRELPLAMAAGQIDMAIEIARPVEAALRQVQLLSEPLCVVAGPGFVGELDAQAYLAAGHVAVASWRRGLSFEDLALSHLGLARSVRQRCQNYHAACLIAANSDLLLTMARRHAELLNRGNGNRILPLPLPLPPVGLNLYWHGEMEQDACNLWLRQQLLLLAGDRG